MVPVIFCIEEEAATGEAKGAGPAFGCLRVHAESAPKRISCRVMPFAEFAFEPQSILKARLR